MNIKTYSHCCNNSDWTNDKIAPVVDAIQKINITVRKNCSEQLRELILRELQAKGWSSKVKISYGSQISITATSEDWGLCLQTGNMSRFYADLLKLQYLYQKGTIKAAIYILPTKWTAKLMGSNLANFERMTDELKLFAEIITIPLFVVGID